MAASFHKVPQHSSASSYGGSGKGAAASATTDMVHPEQFPVGLRVLVVDDDVATLKILERMSVRCHYRVTTCDGATAALNLLRERKGCFDVVLSDVHMPEMDGYKLLEHVGMEMDLPVIMMSADGTTSAVMKGISHGACDYLIKPVRDEELKNIWQHVVRKMWNGNKEHENSGNLEDNNRNKQANDDGEYISVDATEGIVKAQKRSSLNEEDVELDADDPSKSKKPRVVWSVELHNQFVSAVNQLGLDKAVPKRILELMNVPGLTRENVASHLQKFRLYLRQFSGVAQQQNGMPNTGLGTKESRLGAPGGFDVQALAAAGHAFPETVAALQAELLGTPTTNIITTVDQASWLQASIQGPKGSHAEQAVAYGQPLVNCPPNIAKNFPHSILTVDDTSSGYGAWLPSNKIDSLGPNSSVGRVGVKTNNVLMDIPQHQPRQQQQLPLMRDQSCSINVQPSCLVAPSRSSGPFNVVVNSPASVNMDCSFGSNTFTNHGLFSQQSNNSLSISHFPDVNTKSSDVLCGFTTGSISPQLLSCSINSINSNIQQVQNSTMAIGNMRPLPRLLPMSDRQALRGTQSGLGNLGFVDSSTLIPSRHAANQIESSVSNFSQMKVSVDINGSTVNEEPNSINDPAVSHQDLQR